SSSNTFNLSSLDLWASINSILSNTHCINRFSSFSMNERILSPHSSVKNNEDSSPILLSFSSSLEKDLLRISFSSFDL
ncbi:hypothetical protein, partial [Shigella boydii]|uniref:hypothetical protein n=1 Tax=Shigella boydii TaxID=621 RepID=UPI001C0A7275